MTDQFFPAPIKTSEGWQVIFAFEVLYRPSEEWIEMRWGFSPQFLLEEALDRQRLFIESQSIPREMFLASDGLRHTLAIRGVNTSNNKVQIALLGKVVSPNPDRIEIEARSYARMLHSIFPHDFVLIPAASQEDHDRLLMNDFFEKEPDILSIQRSFAAVPLDHGSAQVAGFWQSATRSNEQIWRALAGNSQQTVFNIAIQPTMLYEGERNLLEKLLTDHKADESNINAPSSDWIHACAKRRLNEWGKIFLMQIHILADGEVDQNLVRSIGSALSRDTNGQPSLGFRVENPNSTEEKIIWQKQVGNLDIIPTFSRIDDIADLDEVCSVFQFPYRPKTGLQGVHFAEAQDSTKMNQQ